jgi:hypothetical protein
MCAALGAKVVEEGRPPYSAYRRDSTCCYKYRREKIMAVTSLRDLPVKPDPKLFVLLAEQVRDYAVFLLDTGGRVISWNAGAQLIKGYRADEIIGRHFSVFYTHDALKSDMSASDPDSDGFDHDALTPCVQAAFAANNNKFSVSTVCPNASIQH